MRWLSVLVVIALALGAGGYLYWKENRIVPGQVPLRPIQADEIATHVRKLAGIDAGALAMHLTADSAIAAFARQVAAGKNSDLERAQAMVAALRERARRESFVDW